MRVLVFDPAGNHGTKEGFGTTGWATFNEGNLTGFGHISSENYDLDLEYWDAVTRLIESIHGHIELDYMVCESYNLLGSKALVQSGSSMPTSQLIGIIRMYCHHNNINFVFQSPKDKVRVADPILVHMGILTQTEGGRYHAMGRQTVEHERDAIRHGVFFHRYNNHKVNSQARV
jgi:hypothetical protein